MRLGTVVYKDQEFTIDMYDMSKLLLGVATLVSPLILTLVVPQQILIWLFWSTVTNWPLIIMQRDFAATFSLGRGTCIQSLSGFYCGQMCWRVDSVIIFWRRLAYMTLEQLEWRTWSISRRMMSCGLRSSHDEVERWLDNALEPAWRASLLWQAELTFIPFFWLSNLIILDI